MAENKKLSPRRAEVLSLFALLLQVAFFLLALLVSSQVKSLAVHIEAWHFLGGAGIWLVLFLQFRQRRLADEERFDIEQYERLRREGKDTSVFEATMLESQMHVAAKRLTWMEKYLLSIFSVINAGYLLGIAFWLQAVVRNRPEGAFDEKALEAIAYLAGFALVSFVFSRYAVGMSQQAIWRPLRAGGSYLFSNALACFALGIILFLAQAGYNMAEQVTGYVLVVLMLVIGLEILLNLLMDAYRPRIKGQYRRAPYESRLLGLFCEPGGILRTASHALDYQFGFKVSETWFYKLLEKAVVPMLILQALILYLLSCFTVVPPGHQGVLERFGKPVNTGRAGEAKPYESGMHLKLPWPIDTVKTFPVDQVQTIDIGFVRNDPIIDKNGREIPVTTPILWTKEHWKEEFPFLIAVPGAKASEGNVSEDSAKSVIDMLVLAVSLQYKIGDVAQYGYGQDKCYKNPRELLTELAYRQVVHYCATTSIKALLGSGRHNATEHFKKVIQAKVDQNNMGIKIVFVGLESVHPPVKVAESFEKVVSALQDKQALILQATGAAREILARADGQSEVLKAEADAYHAERTKVAEADAKRFTQQLEAYKKGGDVYRWREFLSVLDERLPSMRKYIISSDDVKNWTYEIDLKEKLQPDLMKGLGVPQEKQENQP
ncbi:MAG: protease modulator HflK [Phycisphaerae bacterium]|nr:protease modulator HflK [Phycisphaerae bacterium]